jgi:hypothetical protein
MTAALGVLANVAVIGLLPPGVPCAIHTSMPVVPRPEHLALTKVQFNPRPDIEDTLTLGRVEIAAM